MPTEIVSTLTEGQPAQLDLGERSVACVVLGFTGNEVVLAASGSVVSEALTPPGPAYLVIESGGTLQALKAQVRAGMTEGELTATLLDRFRLGQRRQFSRAPVIVPVNLRPVGDEEEPWTSFTRDVSAGGLRIARQSTYREADEHEVVLRVVQADREIRATASVARVTERDVSLAFTVIDSGDRLALAQLTFGYHRRRAGQ